MPTAGQERVSAIFPARRFRQFATLRGDLLVAAVLAVPIVGSLAYQARHDHRPLALLLSLAIVGAILARRGRLAAGLLLAVAAQAVLPDNRALLLPVMVVLYEIAAHAPWRTPAAAGAGAAVVAVVAGAIIGSGVVTDHGGLPGYAISCTACYAAAVAAGLYVGARRRVLESLHERAERLDRERELLADRAVAEERIRIAQELHDIVAHNVSLMVVEAQALGATARDDQVSQSTNAIADLGRQAMTEMHTTLRLLRGNGDTPELTPQPGLSQVERLVEQLRRAGLEIEFTVEGQPRRLAQGVDLSAFRIIQEALTNVLKHAAGASTTVTLAYRVEGIELAIVDTDDDHGVLIPEPSDGHGVIGMRERAALFGGTLTTEAVPGGFKVTAMLPYEPAVS
jgi:signal transduction histidine kinase